MESYIIINGKKAELTEEQLEKLGIKIEKDIFNPKECEGFYFINSIGAIEFDNSYVDTCDIKKKNVANCCTDRDIMQQRAWHEILDRLLWRFSIENNSDQTNTKYYIQYNPDNSSYFSGYVGEIKPMEPHFASREVAEKAIKEVVKPFMKEHPKFVWGKEKTKDE